MKEIESLQAKLKIAEDALEEITKGCGLDYRSNDTILALASNLRAHKALAELRKTE